MLETWKLVLWILMKYLSKIYYFIPIDVSHWNYLNAQRETPQQSWFCACLPFPNSRFHLNVWFLKILHKNLKLNSNSILDVAQRFDFFCMVKFFSFCKSRDHKEFFSEVFSSIHLAFKGELSRHNVGYASLTVHGHL